MHLCSFLLVQFPACDATKDIRVHESSLATCWASKYIVSLSMVTFDQYYMQFQY